MFTSKAYSEPSVLVAELKQYFASIGKNNGWGLYLTNESQRLVDEAYADSYSIFKFDETIVKEIVQKVTESFEKLAIEEGQGNPTNIPKYDKVMNVLFSLSDTAFFVDQQSGVSGIAIQAQDQLEEQSKKLEETRDKTFDRLIPIIGIGIVAYFVIPRVATTLLEKK